MKSFDTELKKYTEKTRLKAAERRELRERILSYMEYHPLPKQHEVITRDMIVSQHFITIPFNSLYTRLAAGVFAVVLIVGVPLFAERSVPGDALYLVKTEINEGVRAQLADSPYEKVALETKLIERRISEARLLAREGKLTEAVQAEIAETVRGHASAAQSGLVELRASDVDEAAIAEIAFSTALDVQSAVLDTQLETSTTSSVSVLQDVVDSARAEVGANKSEIAPSFDGLMARIEQETTRAYELLESIKTSATDEEQTDITRRLSDIERAVITAKDLHATAPETSGVQELADALGLIQKLIVFMTDIDVRETVTLESLVPVVRTPEEQMAAIQALFDDITARRGIVTTHLEDITEPATREKVLLGLESVGLLTQGATTTIVAAAYDSIEKRLEEALVLIIDLEYLTTSTLPVILDPVVTDVSTTTADGSATTTDAGTGTTTEEVIAVPAE